MNNESLLQDQLHGVSQRLQKTRRTGLVGSDAHLDTRRYLAFKPHPKKRRNGELLHAY